MLELELLLIFVASTIGLTNIIVDSSVSENTFKYLVRLFFKYLERRVCTKVLNKLLWIKEGIDCHMCMGFWSGLICSYLLGLSPHICFGFAGSFLASFYYVVIEYLMSNSTILLPQDKEE